MSLFFFAFFLLNYAFFIFNENERPESLKTTTQISGGKQIVFLQNIERHYLKLVAHFNEEKIDLLADELVLFQKNGKLSYKDVQHIKKKAISHLEKKVRKIPVSKALDNLKIYMQLLKLDPDNSKYKHKVSFYKDRIKKS